MDDAATSRVAWYRRRRRVLAMVVAVAVVAAGSGLWWWASRDPLKLPASACWSVLDRNDLRRLAGDAGGTFTGQSWTAGHDDDESRFDLDTHNKTCVVEGSRKTLLEVRVGLLDETFFEYETEHTPEGLEPEKQLDLGPDILGRESIGMIRLAFRCENLTTRDQGLRALEVTVSEDSRITNSKQASIQQARLDIALKVAKAAAERAYPCLKKVEFPTSAVAPGF